MSPGVRRRDSVITKEVSFFYIKQVLISVVNANVIKARPNFGWLKI